LSWKKITRPDKRSPGYKTPRPAFVKQHLESLVSKKGGSSWFLICPFHGDNNPSLSVIVDPTHRMSVGSWKCFGCGKIGRWNDLAEAINLPTISSSKIEREFLEGETSFFSMIETNEEEESLGDNLPIGKNKSIPIEKLSPWPKTQLWRGFSGGIIRKYGGHLYTLDRYYPLLFLCAKRKARTQVIGAIRCRRKSSKGYPSYIFTRGKWISKYLFLEERTKPSNIIVLVEGVRDALAWVYHKVPTLAILGTHSPMTDTRIATLLGLGAERVILFMDGDRPKKGGVIPGKKGAESLKESLERDFEVKVFRTWKYYPGKDPFKLAKDPDFVRKFKEWMRR